METSDRDHAAAERLRRVLRPPDLPRIAGAEVAVRHEPAGDLDLGVGFYDLFADDGIWRVVAGAVAGRGVESAVLVGLARQALRPGAGDAGPAAALGRLDRLVRDFGHHPLARMSALCVDLTRRGRGFTVTAARAAHPPPLVLRSTGAVLSLDVPGGPLGRWPDPEPAELGLELRPGDSLLLCAGGTTGGGPGRDPRFPAAVAGCAGWSPGPLLEHLGLVLARGGGSAAAGVSFLALRVRGGRTRTRVGWSTG